MWPTASAIETYISTAKRKALDANLSPLDFGPALAAATRLATAAQKAHQRQSVPSGDLARINLRYARQNRRSSPRPACPTAPWYRHTIYAPGEFTGYAAVVIPGVNEAIDARTRNSPRSSWPFSPGLSTAPQVPWTQCNESELFVKSSHMTKVYASLRTNALLFTDTVHVM